MLPWQQFPWQHNAVIDPASIPPPSVGFLVWQLSTRWQLELDRALAPLDLTATRYAVLASLQALSRDGYAPRQRELADLSGLDRILVSKVVRVLEGAGMLTRTHHPDDNRAVAVRITEHGRATVAEARSKVLELETQRFTALGGRGSPRAEQLVESLHALLKYTKTPPPQSPS